MSSGFNAGRGRTPEECSPHSTDSWSMSSSVAAMLEAERLHPPTPERSSKVWWAQLLEAHGQTLGLERPPSLPSKLNVVSACSGCCAEAFVFKDKGQVTNNNFEVVISIF